MAIAPSFATEVSFAGNVTTDTISMTNDASPATPQETTVTYLMSSTYSVVIPKTITLDGATKASDYTVKVSGDISSDKQVRVAPIDKIADAAGINFHMVDQATVGTKKANVQADVTQDVVVWTSAEVCAMAGTSKGGSISAQGLTSGSWQGTFEFNIALEDVPTV